MGLNVAQAFLTGLEAQVTMHRWKLTRKASRRRYKGKNFGPRLGGPLPIHPGEEVTFAAWHGSPQLVYGVIWLAGKALVWTDPVMISEGAFFGVTYDIEQDTRRWFS